MLNDVTILELLNGYGVFKNLLDRKLLTKEEDEYTYTINLDEITKLFESQNLALKKELINYQNTIKEIRNYANARHFGSVSKDFNKILDKHGLNGDNS